MAHTDPERPAGPGLVVVADPLQLAATCNLSHHELEGAPQEGAVQEEEELHQCPKMGGGGHIHAQQVTGNQIMPRENETTSLWKRKGSRGWGLPFHLNYLAI